MSKIKSRRAAVIFVIFFLSAGIFHDCLAFPFESLYRRRIKEGMEAPDFTLSDLSGQEVALSSLQGKAIILFFWTTWCSHCRTQLRALARIYPEMQKENIELLAINIREDKNKVESFIARYNADFPILLDRLGRAADRYDIEGIPTFYFISRKGKIVHIGYNMPSNYKAILQRDN